MECLLRIFNDTRRAAHSARTTRPHNPTAHLQTPMYIQPRFPRLDECYFYHSFDFPQGRVEGQWDLRDNWQAYLGHTDFSGQSVLEIGPASGFLSFSMEQAGAMVTCVEPPMSYLWDIVPLKSVDVAAWRADFSPEIERVRNSFWYAHHALESRVRMVEVDPYRMPDSLGEFDVGVLASVLLHCRRPFDLMENVAALTRKTIIVTEEYKPHLGEGPVCTFLPQTGVALVNTWWHFTPQFFVSALGVLGFTRARVIFHKQRQPAEMNREVDLFTVVCERPDANPV